MAENDATGFSQMSREVQEQLRRVNLRLDDMVKLTTQIARNDERMTGLQHRVERLEAKYDTLERDVYGPEGMLVKLTHTMTKNALVIAVLVSAATIGVNILAKVFIP